MLGTEISPELVPGDEGDGRSSPARRSIGPYELQDFNLYYTLRFGYAPPRVAFLAYCAWHDRDAARWPDMPPSAATQYAIGEIKRHLGTFVVPLLPVSQFKRSAHPERAQGRLGRLAVAARRLARAERRRSGGLAGASWSSSPTPV